MSVFGVFLDVIAPVLLIAVAGGVVGRALRVPSDALSNVVFFLFTPALVFVTVAEIDLAGGEVARIVAVGVIVFAVNVAIALAWSHTRGDDAETTATAAMAAAISNQGNLGLPVAALAFGEPGLRVAVVSFTTGVLLSSSAGIAVGSLGRTSAREALVSPLRYPIVYTAAMGVAVNLIDIDLPASVAVSTGSLADAAIPSMLVVLGLEFRQPRARDLLETLAPSVNRLVIGPLVAWPVATAVGLTGTVRAAVLVSSAMPTAVLVTILAMQVNSRPEMAVRSVVLSTLLSIGTLTALITLVT